MSDPAAIPEHGRSPAELLAEVDRLAAGDIDWRGGRAFSLVYNVDDEEHEHLLADVAGRFLHDNALNPFKYPSLLQMELDLIAMACGLFGTAPDAGALTSGGTESIFLAVQVARDHARSRARHRRAPSRHADDGASGVRQGGQVPRRGTRARAGRGRRSS